MSVRSGHSYEYTSLLWLDTCELDRIVYYSFIRACYFIGLTLNRLSDLIEIIVFLLFVDLLEYAIGLCCCYLYSSIYDLLGEPCAVLRVDA